MYSGTRHGSSRFTSGASDCLTPVVLRAATAIRPGPHTSAFKYRRAAALPRDAVVLRHCFPHLHATARTPVPVVHARLQMLRRYLSQPSARRIVQQSVSFGGATYISLSLSTPVRIDSKNNSTMAAHDNKEKDQGEVVTQGRFSKWFPLSAKAGLEQWWASLSPMATEHRVLSFIPYLQRPPTHTETGAASDGGTSVDIPAPLQHANDHTVSDRLTDPYGPRRWSSQMVTLSGKDRALNELSVERLGEHVEHNLVMLHGYGAGLGFFYRNFESISRAEGWKVYALDLLGMGRSSRPNFKIHAKDKEGKIAEAESWFIDALEEWRIQRGLERFTLLGHSLGGYLAVAYALKYPGHLEKLILASPVGIPEDPYAVNEDLPDPSKSTMVNEFTQDAAETRNGIQSSSADNNNFMNQANKKDSSTTDGLKPPARRFPGWFHYLWEANMISPFSFVRWSGPLGPRLVSGWTSRRFSQLPEEEAQALHDYSYAIFRQRGSSEYALGYLLAPGAFARSPLIRRIQGVGRQWVDTNNSGLGLNSNTALSAEATRPEGRKENGYPIIFMYGENDWMDVAGGLAAEEKIKQERQRILLDASAEEKKRDQGEAKVVIIQKAGHHVYLDGWEQFNKVMLEEMEDVKRREKERIV